MQTLEEYISAGMGIAFHANMFPTKKAVISEHGERTFHEHWKKTVSTQDKVKPTIGIRIKISANPLPVIKSLRKTLSGELGNFVVKHITVYTFTFQEY